MRLLRAAAAAIAFICLSTSGLAQDSREQSGTWFVSADPSLGRGCFASRAYKDGTVFRIGLNRLTNTGYIAIGSPAWSSLQRGRTYLLRLVFGSAPSRDRRATAVSVDGTMTLWMGFVDPEVFVEFVDAPTLQIWSKKQLLSDLALRGSRDALLALVNCQSDRRL